MPTPDDYNNNQPGLLQRGPTSLLPPIPPPPTNDNDPTKIQEAAVPRVPPPTPRADRQPTPSDSQPQPPTPQQAPYTPVPWHAQQPPPAPPEPPLGNWTPDQVAPWLKAHLPTIPGSLVPNRPPDGYSGSRPVYNLRPGEPGYTAGGNSNILTGAVSWLENRNRGPFGDRNAYGQDAAFIAQWGPGPQGLTKYATELLRANPNATFGDFYAGYALGTGDPRRAPTLEDLRTRYPEAYKNLVTNFPAQAGGGGALPGTPSGPQGPWTQANLEANFAYRTGSLGQPGHVQQLANVTSPNGQTWSVNARVAPQFQGFLNDLYKAGYTGMVSSGGYNDRPVVGGSIPSEHAYGAAIDIGAAHNPLQYVSAGGALRTDLPPNVGEIAAKWGLKWGGTFHDRQDPMHFEVAALMTPEQIQAAQNGAVTTAPQGTRVAAGSIGINTPLSTLLGSTVAAPPQQYIPPQPREPQHWGREPEHDWTPGRMPTSHDIPNILGALLPIAIAGVLGGGGLGMIAAYAGYQNARNKGQLEEAKEQRTRWRDQLAETEAGLKEELLESSGLMAEFGNDFTSPAAQQAWGELAAKYQDPQLRAALESGNPAAVEQLFKKRDEAFQSINKVSAADTKAAQQEQEKQSNEAAERSTTTPDGGGGGAPGAAPGATPAAARGPERPWENLGPGFAGGGPAAGGQPTPPAAAPRPAGQPAPAPEQPPADQPAPPAEGQPPEAPAPGADGQPQPAAAPGQPPPEHFDVGVGGLAPANLPARLAPQVTGLTPDRLDQDARQYLETQKDPYKGGPSGDPLAIVRNEAVRVRASQMQSFIDKVIRDTKPGDIEGALQKLDTVDPGMAAIARSVDRGDQPQPTGWQLRVPLYQTVNKLVTSLDPTFSATRYITNWRTKVAYSTGTQSIQVASINRALQHMTVLMDAAKHLGNTDYPSWNALVNAVQTQLGSDAATNFTAARSAVSRELERAFRGGSGAYAEIKQDLENVGTSGSPAQILGLIRTDTELLRGQLDALADLYSRGTHTTTTGDDLLSPQARHTYERIMQMPLDRPPPETTTVNGKAVPVGPDKQELDPTIPYPSAGPGPAPAELPPGVTVTEEP